LPECEDHPARATAGLEELRLRFREVALNQRALGGPQAQFVSRAGIVEHCREVVEIGPDDVGGDLLWRRRWAVVVPPLLGRAALAGWIFRFRRCSRCAR